MRKNRRSLQIWRRIAAALTLVLLSCSFLLTAHRWALPYARSLFRRGLYLESVICLREFVEPLYRLSGLTPGAEYNVACGSRPKNFTNRQAKNCVFLQILRRRALFY